MEIEEIAEQHSIKDLGRISPAYECGFTQGANYIMKKTCEWIRYNNENGGCQFDNWEDDYRKAIKQ